MSDDDTIRPFSNGTEQMMWLESNCMSGAGCRNYKPEASSSRHGCPMEVAISIGQVKPRHALPCGLLVEGPQGTLVEPVTPIRCPEYRGKDEPGPPRMPRPRPVDGAQFDLLDPRNEPVPERVPSSVIESKAERGGDEQR